MFLLKVPGENPSLCSSSFHRLPMSLTLGAFLPTPGLLSHLLSWIQLLCLPLFGFTRIIRDNLPISISSITSASSLLTWKITYSEVPGISMLISSESNYSVYHCTQQSWLDKCLWVPVALFITIRMIRIRMAWDGKIKQKSIFIFTKSCYTIGSSKMSLNLCTAS